MRIATLTLAASLLLAPTAQAQMLIGWAKMPAATFADGPTSGRFIAPNLPSSGGFEGMAISKDRTRLYTLLEGQVAGDAAKSRRIDEFDLAKERYTGRSWVYPLAPEGTNIGDMVAVDSHRFIVLERNGSTATSPATSPPPFKKVYLIDLKGVPAGGTVRTDDNEHGGRDHGGRDHRGAGYEWDDD